VITVLNGGTQSLIMDAGRPGYRHQGIPGGGAADHLNFALANWLVGNPWKTSAIEVAIGGLHLRFQSDTQIALTGAQTWAQINGQNVLYNTAIKVKAGDILTLSFARDGCRSYIAIKGGLLADICLGSYSTYIPAAFGGYKGRALKVGDCLHCGPHNAEVSQTLPPGYAPRLARHIVLRARPAPEWDRLSLASKRYIFTSPFIASSDTDRMGCRLRGDKLKTDNPVSMTSSPLLPGTLQVPPDGHPILALSDAHCTGGYPRALQIIQADLWLLGQIAPGSYISFRRCFAEEAPKILSRRNAFYGGLIPGFSF